MPTIDLAALTAAQGVRIDGATRFAGEQVALAGDVNGDGLDDLLILSGGDGLTASLSILYGQAGGLPMTISLGALDPSQGITIPASFFNSRAIAPLGDINADGLDDIVFYSPLSNRGFVIYGQGGGFAGPITLPALPPSLGFEIVGTTTSMLQVGPAGDFNGDGLQDLFVIDPGGNGQLTVAFGQPGGFADTLDLATLNLVQAVRINGAANASVASATSLGDVNGDGVDDLLIGGGSGFSNYVVYGRAGGFAAPVTLGSLAPAQGFRIDPPAGRDVGGRAVALGDVNGDGRNDFALSERGVQSGSVFVVYGPAFPPTGPLDLGALTPALGFRIDGAAVGIGGLRPPVPVAAAGDVNGDGVADILVGARAAMDGAETPGAAYVVYGRAGGVAGPVNLNWLADEQGFRILGAESGDRTGESVSAAGDVNGDGFADLLVGALTADPGGVSNLGRAYVVFGFGQAITFTGTAADETRNGGPLGDVMNGQGGNDSLAGLGGSDTLLGGAGNDSLAGGASADLLDGGEGNDILDGGAGADTMIGGAGFDVYVVDDPGDVLLEDAEGLARVESSINWRLGEAFLDLTLTGTGSIDGTGNRRDNGLIGNAGANRLDGKVGNDHIAGLDGEDILVGGGGDDILLGGLGNDVLRGGGGTDMLVGGPGRDTLSGAAGADRFRFVDAPIAGLADRITDFAPGQDRIEILLSAFDPSAVTGLSIGRLSTQAGRFETNLTGQATAGTTRLIYESDTSRLFWDLDGTGPAARVEVALLAGTTPPLLAAGDIWII